ncbi:hypothetical protein OS493_026454 [Desmophyllum pertusum]|uniref:SGNH hydrolase-type esterase domain-containing protein n=1 Tax=Desmophyllum pertusum TaxID=174260 RepID=A0A9X0CRA5_9CNID|nr:hypothetical protein OS493_026454 [Desmophyllum pertusum]
MVGEQGNRTSGARGCGTASVPQSYWWKRIHNLNARSRLQEVSGSLNCAERFSSLVSCHRGYGSVAFYAVFSLFILTFLYTIWKIVSAHSRSARRPGSGNSTSATKLSPTEHVPTGYASAHGWIKTENILDHFHQSVKKLRPFQNEAPQRKPSPAIYSRPENEERDKISSVTNNVDYPIRGNDMLGNPSPTWPSSGRTTKRFYNYYPAGSYNTGQPPVNYPYPYPTAFTPSFPTVPYPTAFNPSFPTVPYRTVFNPYFRLPFPGGINNNQRFPFGTKASNLIPYNSNSEGIFNEKAAPLSSPFANVSYRAPYYFPTSKSTLPQSSYDNSYYGDSTFQNTGGVAQTSPSPLISFLTESSHHADKLQHHKKQSKRKRKKPRRKITRHNKKKSNHFRKQPQRKITRHNRKKPNHFKKHLEYEYIEDIEEKSNRNSKKARSTRHRKVKGNKKTIKHIRKKYHEKKMNKDRRYGISKHRGSHARKYKRTHISTKGHKDHYTQHHTRKHLKIHHKKLPDISRKYRRTNIPHPQKSTKASYLKPSRHVSPKKHFRAIHRRPKHLHVHRASHRRHHNILDFKLYRRYRKHHSVDDEIDGKWKVSRHRVRTCKLIHQFSTRGTVKITRTIGHNRRFLHTLLICRPVRLRIRRGHHRRRFSLKYAQLCSKKWYVTKGVIHVHETSLNDQEIPRYNVRICEPSYAHAMKLLPGKGKETKVWNIAETFVRKMEKEDVKSTSMKRDMHKHNHKKRDMHKHNHKKRDMHKHNHKKRKTNQHKEKKKENTSEKGGSNKKPRKHLSRGNHVRKTVKHTINRHHESKYSHHVKQRVKQSKSAKKSHDKGKKKHDRTLKDASKNNKKDSPNKTKSGVENSDKLFYGKLLKVLKLAKMYDKKKANTTMNDDVFDSLEAVLAQSQNVTKTSMHNKHNSATELNGKKNKTTKHKSRQKISPKQTQKSKEKSTDNIQKLLAKILPAVVGIIKGDTNGGESAVTMVTTKPTKPTTTQKTSTSKPTPTSQIPPSKTTNNIEDIMKNILPLLLKRAGKAQRNPLPGLKSKPRAKKPPSPPKQRSPQPKKPMDKSSLTSILSSLGLGNLVSNSLSSTILTKEAAVTKKLAMKPTQRSTITRLTSTLLPKIPVQSPVTRSTPTPSVTTIQAPPPLKQPDTVRPSARPPGVQSTHPPAISQISAQPLPPVPLSVPSSVQLPVPQPASSQISAPISTLQSAVFPQGINPDPYSRSILCFGDSLTSGFYNHGHNFHPYSQRLSQLLNSEGRLKYYVKTSGKVREMAHGSMSKRLPEVLGNSSRFDWVIILGGTNDVAHVKNFGDDDSFMNQLINIWKPRIVRDIEVLHEIAHKYGARTVLLTVPETAYEAWPSYKTLWVMRNRLNQDLRDYALRSQGNVVLCDLAAKLPRHSLSPQAQALLWNDHLHLTPYGYDKMAEIVYQCLKPYLTQQDTSRDNI